MSALLILVALSLTVVITAAICDIARWLTDIIVEWLL